MLGIYDLYAPRRITSAGYTSYSMPILHPDRVMPEHDLIYLLEGGWEILSLIHISYVQALLLARCLRGDLEGYPPFLWK